MEFSVSATVVMLSNYFACRNSFRYMFVKYISTHIFYLPYMLPHIYIIPLYVNKLYFIGVKIVFKNPTKVGSGGVILI